MSKLAIIGGTVAVVGALVMVPVVSYISANNVAVNFESNLKAARDNNKNLLATHEQKIREAAQVPEMYKNDFKEIVNASMQGRYGADGSKAMFQFLKEHDIKIDSTMYIKLQNMVESGRNDFAAGQTRMLDIRREYEAQQGYAWRGLWLRIAGFPKVNMKDFEPVVTDRVEQTFVNNKESAPIKLR